MKISNNLADRLREVFLDGTWIAHTNYKKILSEVDQAMATTKIGNLNTIAMLTYHVNYFLEGLLPVLDGGALDIQDKYSFDLPPIKTEADWQKLVNDLLSNAEKFIEKVRSLSDEKLLGPFVDEKYGTYLRNMEGVIEHSYYHLGQVALIKKQLHFINRP